MKTQDEKSVAQEHKNPLRFLNPAKLGRSLSKKISHHEASELEETMNPSIETKIPFSTEEKVDGSEVKSEYSQDSKTADLGDGGSNSTTPRVNEPQDTAAVDLPLALVTDESLSSGPSTPIVSDTEEDNSPLILQSHFKINNQNVISTSEGSLEISSDSGSDKHNDADEEIIANGEEVVSYHWFLEVLNHPVFKVASIALIAVGLVAIALSGASAGLLMSVIVATSVGGIGSLASASFAFFNASNHIPEDDDDGFIPKTALI